MTTLKANWFYVPDASTLAKATVVPWPTVSNDAFILINELSGPNNPYSYPTVLQSLNNQSSTAFIFGDGTLPTPGALNLPDWTLAFGEICKGLPRVVPGTPEFSASDLTKCPTSSKRFACFTMKKPLPDSSCGTRIICLPQDKVWPYTFVLEGNGRAWTQSYKLNGFCRNDGYGCQRDFGNGDFNAVRESALDSEEADKAEDMTEIFKEFNCNGAEPCRGSSTGALY